MPLLAFLQYTGIHACGRRFAVGSVQQFGSRRLPSARSCSSSNTKPAEARSFCSQRHKPVSTLAILEAIDDQEAEASLEAKKILPSPRRDVRHNEDFHHGHFLKAAQFFVQPHFQGMGSETKKVKSFAQDLRGKHFVVTGANTGIGYATSRELAKMGAKVTMACRSADRGKGAVDKLRSEALAKPVAQGVDLLEGLDDVDVKVEILDLASFQSITSFADRLKAGGAKVDVLINNAGVMALPERRETQDGLEMQIGVNHFGGHLLTRLMEPIIKDGGRVIFVSSLAHRRPLVLGAQSTTLDWDNINYEKPDTYNNWMAYGRSKLANILDAKEFAKRLAGRSINVYAVHPGIVNTELMRNMTDSSLMSRVTRLVSPLAGLLLATPLTGALTTLRCAVDPSLSGIEFTGKYWGNMEEEEPSELAKDPANPLRYWKITEEILEAKLGQKVDNLVK